MQKLQAVHDGYDAAEHKKEHSSLTTKTLLQFLGCHQINIRINIHLI